VESGKRAPRSYALVKSLERLGLRRADAGRVLTERLRGALLSERLVPAEKLHVIPCCTDLSLYPVARQRLSPPTAPGSRLELIYARVERRLVPDR